MASGHYDFQMVSLTSLAVSTITLFGSFNTYNNRYHKFACVLEGPEEGQMRGQLWKVRSKAWKQGISEIQSHPTPTSRRQISFPVVREKGQEKKVK